MLRCSRYDLDMLNWPLCFFGHRKGRLGTSICLVPREDHCTVRVEAKILPVGLDRSRADCRSLRLVSVLDHKAQPRSDRLHYAKVIRGECILPCSIKSQHGCHPGGSLERHGQRRSQRAVLRGIVQIARLDRRIAVQDRLMVLRDPSREPFAFRNSQGREQPEIVPAHELGREHSVLQHIHGHGVVRHQVS